MTWPCAVSLHNKGKYYITEASSNISENLKIRIELHEGERDTVKIWRFNTNLKEGYSVKRVEDEVAHLFPRIVTKNMRVKLYHVDDLAGRVDIESDADMM